MADCRHSRIHESGAGAGCGRRPAGRRLGFRVPVFRVALREACIQGGKSVSDTIAAVLQSEPDWQALPQGTPSKIRELLRQCLQKDVNTLEQYSRRPRDDRRIAAWTESPPILILALAAGPICHSGGRDPSSCSDFLAFGQCPAALPVRWVPEQAIPQHCTDSRIPAAKCMQLRLLRRRGSSSPLDSP